MSSLLHQTQTLEGKLALHYTLTMCSITRIVPGHQAPGQVHHQECTGDLPPPSPAKSHPALSKPKLCKVRQRIEMVDLPKKFHGLCAWRECILKTYTE